MNIFNNELWLEFSAKVVDSECDKKRHKEND